MKLNKMREEIANQFITALKEDKIPWRKDWSAVSDMPGFNRHMVECGLWTFYIVLSLSYVLIDT